MGVKGLIIVSVDLPYPEMVPEILTHMDPPGIPCFTGEVRVVVGPNVDEVIEFLEEAGDDEP